MVAYRWSKAFYPVMTALCALSLIWIAINWWLGSAFSVCLFSSITSLPCPACGTTRSALQLLSGNLAAAVAINPLGLVAAAVIVGLPPWLVFDFTLGKQSLQRSYEAAEQWLTKKPIAIVTLVALAVHWAHVLVKSL